MSGVNNTKHAYIILTTLNLPHFYIVKLGFTGVYFFLFCSKYIDCGYSLEPPRRGSSNEYHKLCIEQKYENCRNFSSENFHFFFFFFFFFFFCGKILNIFE